MGALRLPDLSLNAWSFAISQACRHSRRRRWFWVEVHINLEAEFGRWEVETQQSGMSNWREIMALVLVILLCLVCAAINSTYVFYILSCF